MLNGFQWHHTVWYAYHYYLKLCNIWNLITIFSSWMCLWTHYVSINTHLWIRFPLPLRFFRSSRMRNSMLTHGFSSTNSSQIFLKETVCSDVFFFKKTRVCFLKMQYLYIIFLYVYTYNMNNNRRIPDLTMYWLQHASGIIHVMIGQKSVIANRIDLWYLHYSIYLTGYVSCRIYVNMSVKWTNVLLDDKFCKIYILRSIVYNLNFDTLLINLMIITIFSKICNISNVFWSV